MFETNLCGYCSCQACHDCDNTQYQHCVATGLCEDCKVATFDYYIETRAEIAQHKYVELLNSLKPTGFSLLKPTYKRLDSKLSAKVRSLYKTSVDSLGLDPSKPIYTLQGTKIAEGFDRIVIGDYGAYIEYPLSKVPNGTRYDTPKDQQYRKLPEWKCRVKYIWYTAQDSSNIKIYWQLRTVSYADYKTKMFYVSPYEIVQ